ncbi:hypothetical protein HAX54_036459 [Datura stramonium]|uniref:Uncharacterized protein n=1 Tax=Datura stramonium TaxID=4076 RepID=A0ABS8VK71_DATST|nr:hypothetical protein [Datura stramonium]
MEEYCISFKEKRVIHAEAQIDAESFKTACPDIYYQIGMRDWVPFTIPVYPYFPELAACPFFQPLDNTVQVDSVITLATKTDKDASVMKKAKYTWNKTPPPPLASTHTSVASLHTNEFHSPTPTNLLNVAQRAKMHESHLVQLAMAIPSMIQRAIKKTLQPTNYKLTSLCSTVDVLESKVGTLRQEMAAPNAPLSTGHPIPCEPEAMLAQPEAPRSPPNDWWAGYKSDLEIV